MVTCTRRIEWDAMHRVPGHEGRCRAWHGHRYAAEITCAGDLDSCGRVVDFGVVKERVGGWVDRCWDHTAVLQRDDPDPLAPALIDANARLGRPVWLIDGPPTAENLAAELGRVATGLLADAGVRVVRVRLWETPNGSAEWVAEEG